MKTLLRWSPLAVVVALIALFGFGLGKDATLIPSPLVGDAAPDFRLAELDAPDSLSLSDLRGTPVVMNYWASWCLACREEHPALVRAWKRYTRRGVRLIGVVFQDSPENVRRYLEQYGGGWTQLLDPESRTAMDFGVYGVPETYFIDALGRITHKHIGPVSDSLITREVEPLLRPPADPSAHEPPNPVTEP